MQKLKLSSSRMAGTKMPCTMTILTVVFRYTDTALVTTHACDHDTVDDNIKMFQDFCVMMG